MELIWIVTEQDKFFLNELEQQMEPDDGDIIYVVHDNVFLKKWSQQISEFVICGLVFNWDSISDTVEKVNLLKKWRFSWTKEGLHMREKYVLIKKFKIFNKNH